MQWYVHLLFVLIYIPVAALVVCMPFITRKSESFGVRIPVSVYNDASIKKLRKSYVWQTSVWTVALMVGYVLLAVMARDNERLWAYLFSSMLLVFLAGAFVFYLFKHVQMKRLKQEQNWKTTKSQVLVMDTSFRQQRLTYSNGWFLIGFGIVLATAVLSLAYYDAIPEQLPLQYDLNGNVTRFAEKTIGSVLMMPIIQLFMLGVFVFVNVTISKAKQQVQAEDPENSIKQNVIFRRKWSLFTIVMGTALILLFTIAQLSITTWLHYKYTPIIVVVIVGGIVLGSIVMSFTMGQGGSRVKIRNGRKSGDEVNHDDDHYWKLGQFYFNPDDPAVFVEKRFGVGWTVNFARPIAWFMLLGILGLAIGLPIMLQ